MQQVEVTPAPPQQGEDDYGSPGGAIISSDSGLLTGSGVPSSGATSPTGSAADDYGSPSGDILDSGSLVLSNSPFDSMLDLLHVLLKMV